VSAASIHAMRMQWKRASKPAPMTAQERSAARKAKREAHRCEVLQWGMAWWDAEAVRLRALHGPLCAVEYCLGMRPERYSLSLDDLYQRRNEINLPT
jgi:hypothetical protein